MFSIILIARSLIKIGWSTRQPKCVQAVSENEFIRLKWEHLMFSDEMMGCNTL